MNPSSRALPHSLGSVAFSVMADVDSTVRQIARCVSRGQSRKVQNRSPSAIGVLGTQCLSRREGENHDTLGLGFLGLGLRRNGIARSTVTGPRAIGREKRQECLPDSLERHRSFDITSQIHHLLADSRDKRMCRMLLCEVITRHGKDEIGVFGCSWNTEYGTCEEYPVRLGRGEALELACGRGEDLMSVLVVRVGVYVAWSASCMARWQVG
jgi:hypothetical protein